MDPASGKKSRAQCHAAIMTRSAVAFATLSRGYDSGGTTHPKEADSLILQSRDVVRPTKFAGSKLSDASFSCSHRLSFGP